MSDRKSIDVELSAQPVQLNNSDNERKIGVIALSTDLTSERDFVQILSGHKIQMYVTRVAYENPTTPENLKKMAPLLTEAAGLLLPGESLDAICYSCTAASVVIGDKAIEAAIAKGKPDTPVVTPGGAALTAFSALGCRSIAVLTPYLVETTTPVVQYFDSHGLNISKARCLGLDDDRIMARVSDETMIEAALEIDNDDAEALFLSCTGLPAINVIDEIESRTGKPVVTSNQASAWMLAQHAGLTIDNSPYGALFRKKAA